MSVVFLPWRLEFGTMLMHWVRYVHGECKGIPPGVTKVVCCRRGHEPLFPDATEFFYDWEDLPDVEKKWKTARSDEHQQYISTLREEIGRRHPGSRIIEPLRHYKSQQKDSFQPTYREGTPRPKAPDILLAPRYREHGAHRNYQHWQSVSDGIKDLGCSVGLLGAKATSQKLKRVPKSLEVWNYEHDLDVTLWWMEQAKLVVTTDSAMAHLAVLARAPLKVIYDKKGKEAGHPTWPWAFDHMDTHALAHCEPILFGWKDPAIVVTAIKQYLEKFHGS